MKRGVPWWRLSRRNLRQFIAFLVLVGVVLYVRSLLETDAKIQSWENPLEIAVIQITLDDTPVPDEYRNAFLAPSIYPADHGTSLYAIPRWLRDELLRLTGRDLTVVRFHLFGPVVFREPPPKPSDSFFGRIMAGFSFRSFLKRVAKAADVDLSKYLVKLVLVYYPPSRPVDKHSDSYGSFRDHAGLVYVPTAIADIPYNVAEITHELLHTFGAKDKYDGRSTVFPGGYAEPFKTPLLPQRFAEVMAGEIPLSPNRLRPVRGLDELRVGHETALEIGWLDDETVRRYYKEGGKKEKSIHGSTETRR